MIIKIKNLRLRTIIGIFDWERTDKQDVIINATMELDGSRAAQTDKIEDTLDYKTINKDIIELVENAQFFLLETLADHILQLIMKKSGINRATVEVDKPHALRFADSVSVTTSAERSS